MQLVTWNLNGLDDAALDERTEAAVFTMVLGAPLSELQHGTTPIAPPDVIVMQEVTPHTMRAHLAPHLAVGKYLLWPSEPPERESFELCAVRPPFTVTSHDTVPLDASQFDRRLHTFTIGGPDGELRILTAHLDSGSQGGSIRQRQLRQIAAAMDARAVFAGDANLRKAEWEAVKPELDVSDAWEMLGEPQACRVTWRREIDGEQYRARYDRVLLGRGITARSMRPLGVEPLPGLGVHISDHVGLGVELAIA